MRDVADFNDQNHRIQSAGAVFQKGIYHLFLLSRRKPSDLFDKILRTYQSLFQLCLTQLLLDFDYQINDKRILKRLRALCKDENAPTRADLDPAALVNHSTFEENGGWNGCQPNHPLHLSATNSLKALRRIADARHNLVYRPFMLDGPFWEDCTLIDLLKTAPTTDEVEQLYLEFTRAVTDQFAVERSEIPARSAVMNKYIESWVKGDPRPEFSPPPFPIHWANYFSQLLFWVYEDRRSIRPTETLLLTYARMLNPKDEVLLRELRDYRNQLLDVKGVALYLNHPEEWMVGMI